MLWHSVLKFCIRLCFIVLQIKSECPQFPSIFVGVMPLLELRILEIHFFHFSPTCFDKLSLNFAFDFILLYYRSSSCVVDFIICFNFCRSYAPFGTLNTRIHSFPHFSLTCIEILSWNFAYDFVLLYYRSKVSSICINFCGSYAPFELRILEIHSFPHFSLTCFDILSWNFAYDFVLLYYRSRVLSICINFCGSYAPFELRILEIHSFSHFSLTCFDILSWNFAYDFVLLYYKSSLSVVNLHKFLWELCSFLNLEYWKYTVFHTFLLHALTYWA